ncbi:hypothetical protein M1P56_31170 [Streptomyces sp. HU2014]|uniref:Small membrane protein n=1 Tax=Streptomyces albireticuli TaxID=1940 RepID=A0A1Z2L2M3_9ACTN|nr:MULTISPECIES: hypothetical protein [Streptomyces]ARZ68524.1 small membrane protein [Streptomyces albireticuli]UQI48465.1 hypothetical protein M1P56_31170 [Streptomyces sp. HU2014]
MNQAARRIGRTLALVLPVVLVLSGTLAVTRVPWAAPTSESQVLTASSETASTQAKAPRQAHEVLRDRLLTELQEKNPGEALTDLQTAVNGRPSLARHCAELARALGRAAVAKYGLKGAQSFARPVCDTSYAAGVAQTP